MPLLKDLCIFLQTCWHLQILSCLCWPHSFILLFTVFSVSPSLVSPSASVSVIFAFSFFHSLFPAFFNFVTNACITVKAKWRRAKQGHAAKKKLNTVSLNTQLKSCVRVYLELSPMECNEAYYDISLKDQDSDVNLREQEYILQIIFWSFYV